MRTLIVLVAVTFTSLTWYVPANAADPAKKGNLAADRPPKKAYLLFPIRTDLQMNYLFDPSTRYYLMVYGSGLLDKDRKLDPSGFNLDDAALSILGATNKGDKVDAAVIFADRPPTAVRWLLVQAVIGWSHEQGYGRPSATTVIGDSEWQAAVKFVGNARGRYEEEATENGIGDETMKVYPVRSVLSRLRTGNADCVVSFPKPFSKDATGTLDEKTLTRVKALVASLRIQNIKRVQIAILEKSDADKKAVSVFMEKTAPELAKALGVKEYSVSQRYAR